MIRRYSTALFLLAALVMVFVIAGLVPTPALAQSFSLDLGDGGAGSFTGRIIQLLVLMTVLTLAPSILVVVTFFTEMTRMITLLRSYQGSQTLGNEEHDLRRKAIGILGNVNQSA